MNHAQSPGSSSQFSRLSEICEKSFYEAVGKFNEKDKSRFKKLAEGTLPQFEFTGMILKNY